MSDSENSFGFVEELGSDSGAEAPTGTGAGAGADEKPEPEPEPEIETHDGWEQLERGHSLLESAWEFHDVVLNISLCGLDELFIPFMNNHKAQAWIQQNYVWLAARALCISPHVEAYTEPRLSFERATAMLIDGLHDTDGIPVADADRSNGTGTVATGALRLFDNHGVCRISEPYAWEYLKHHWTQVMTFVRGMEQPILSLTVDLIVPPMPGVFVLYARVMHSGMVRVVDSIDTVITKGAEGIGALMANQLSKLPLETLERLREHVNPKTGLVPFHRMAVFCDTMIEAPLFSATVFRPGNKPVSRAHQPAADGDMDRVWRDCLGLIGKGVLAHKTRTEPESASHYPELCKLLHQWSTLS